MSSYVRTERNTLEEFYQFVMDRNNIDRINEAIQNPQSEDAKRILRQIAPFILITGGKYHIHLWKEVLEQLRKFLQCVDI